MVSFLLQLVFCLVLTNLQLCQTLQTTRLEEDGVTIADGGDVQVLAGDWRVWVAIQVPQTPEDFQRELNKMEYLINHPRVTGASNSNNTMAVSPLTKASWLGRIRRIRQDLPAYGLKDDTARRRKRGLLDAVGKLAHQLFGMATDDEVNEIKAAMNTLNSNQAAVVHNVKQLTTMVNSSRLYSTENRERVNEITRRFRRVEMYLPKLDNELNHLALLVEFERILEDLEIKGNTLRDMQRLYEHRRQDLQLGQLTEELLPVRTLEGILNQGTTADMIPLEEKNWYYMYVTLKPMWANSNFLIYEASLPFVRPSKFLLYSLQTWPIPTEKHYSVKIQAEGKFGYNTQNGELFEAESCQGHNPLVCVADPVWGDEGLPCIRGLLLGQKQAMGSCHVEIINSTETVIARLSLNEYVISTMGETTTLRCTGNSSKVIQLDKGAHGIKIDQHCHVKGKGWTIHALHSYNVSKRFMTKALPRLNPLNLTEILRKPLLDFTPGIGLPRLGVMTPISIDQFKNMEVRSMHWRSESATWIVLVIVIAGAVLFVLGLCKMYRQEGKWFPKQCPRKRVTATPVDEESLPEELHMLETECNVEHLGSESVIGPQVESKGAEVMPACRGLMTLKKGHNNPHKAVRLG